MEEWEDLHKSVSIAIGVKWKMGRCGATITKKMQVIEKLSKKEES